MIPEKTKKEIEIMQEGGAIAAWIKEALVDSVCPGVTTAELDKLAEKMIKDAGAIPSFKGYKNFPASIVTCVNEEAIHGIPNRRRLKKGDLLTIDLGVYHRGFHTDTAISVPVGTNQIQSSKPAYAGRFKVQSFLDSGRQALEKAINQVQPGNHIGDISYAIQQTVEKAGFNVIRTFAGHGVGRKLHEPPSIPCFGKKGQGEEIKVGMILAVEVMYVEGISELQILGDGWTVVTKHGKLSAMFEETVAVTKKGPLVLTRS